MKLYEEGTQLVARGTLESLRQAKDRFRRAAEISRTAGNREDEAACLSRLAAVEAALSENQQALEHFNQSLLLARAVKDRSGEAKTLGNIGGIHDNLGDKRKALEYYNQALSIFREQNNRIGEATSLSNIGKTLGDMGELQQALEYLNQALQIRRAEKDTAGEGVTLSNIGNVYSLLGDKTRALSYYSQALPLLRDIKDRRFEAIVLSNIGLTYDALGDKRKALDYFADALAIQRAIGDRSGEGITLNNIGIVHSSQGARQLALDHYNQALTVLRAVGDRRNEAAALSNIGALFYSIGENQKALDYYNQSLPLKEAVGDRAAEAITLNNIGSVFQSSGQTDQALTFYNRALTILRSVGDRFSEATLLNNIGELYRVIGEKQKAIDSLNQALAIRRAVGDRPGQAVTLNNIALVYDSLGEKIGALELYEQSLALERAVGDRSGEALTLFNIAEIERDKNHFSEARERIESALNIIESLRLNIASQKFRASYFSTVQSYYEFYIDLLMRMHEQKPSQGFDSLALQAAERGRARSLLETLTEAGADIRQGIDPQLLELEHLLHERLNAKAQEQMKMLSTKHTENQAEGLVREIETLTTEFQQLETKIREASPGYAALTQPQPLSVKAIQEQVLDADTLLLEYSLGNDSSYLWAVTPSSLTSYRLPRRQEIENAAREVYDLLNTRNKRINGETKAQRDKRVAEADVSLMGAAKALSKIVLTPAAGQLGSKRLVIVADGVLQYIPFAALPVIPGSSETETTAIDERSQDATQHESLIVQHEIVSLPSVSTLSVLRQEIAGRKPAPRTLVALADPVFMKTDERVNEGQNKRKDGTPIAAQRNQPESVRELQLIEASHDTGMASEGFYVPRLLGSRREAEQIAAMVPSSDRKLALDFEANRLLATSPELGQYRYVHFSTHGFLNSVHPELSGIVLSLVNESGEAQDGFLRAHEIFNLKLPAEVVVLSACQTGIGKEVKGEGLVSLTRGFMYAGAPRVVVSLWSVSEMGTVELMVRFYSAMLKERLSPAAALRVAQRSLMKQKNWASPYYWAAFTLQGEWR